jgi:hypothetical protein
MLDLESETTQTEKLGFFQVLLTFRDSHHLSYTFPNSPQNGQIFSKFFNFINHKTLQNMSISVVFGPFFEFIGFRVSSL